MTFENCCFGILNRVLLCFILHYSPENMVVVVTKFICTGVDLLARSHRA